MKVGNRPTVFSVGDWSFRDVDKGLNDFRDKTLLAAGRDDVRSIELIADDGSTTSLTRDEGGKWKVENQNEAADENAISRFLDDLLTLKGYEIVADAPPDLQPFGLVQPKLSVTVRGKDGAELGTARFGTHSPAPPATEYTAQRGGQPTVFHIREYQFTRLNKKAADFAVKPTPTAGAAGGTPAAPPDAEDLDVEE